VLPVYQEFQGHLATLQKRILDLVVVSRNKNVSSGGASEDPTEEFARTLVSDLRPSLEGLSKYVHTLQEASQNRLTPDVREFLEYIAAEADKMAAMVASLSAYADAGKAKPDRVVSCEKGLEDAQKRLADKIASKGARVTHDPLPDVWADAGGLGLLFEYTLDNALKFHGAAPPRVHLSADRQTGSPDHWRITMTDQGIGLSTEECEKIFHLFYVIPGPDTGQGIGLAACSKIVTRMGGGIRMESEAGKGSTVGFTLPAAA
jgi:light-regulated signal transduction histidine kinase (bacteriophytochrome)